MATRYEKQTPQWVYDLLDEVKNTHHSHLDAARFYVWMDTQKRTAGGKIVLGTVNKANAKTRTLAGDYDYEMVLDSKVFKNLQKDQQLHLLHHLLCHCQVITEDEEPAFSLIGSDYPLFTAEMEFNAHWRQTWDDMRTLAAQVHSNKTGVPTNDPDNPNMFGDQAEGGGEDQQEQEAA